MKLHGLRASHPSGTILLHTCHNKGRSAHHASRRSLPAACSARRPAGGTGRDSRSGLQCHSQSPLMASVSSVAMGARGPRAPPLHAVAIAIAVLLALPLGLMAEQHAEELLLQPLADGDVLVRRAAAPATAAAVLSCAAACAAASLNVLLPPRRCLHRHTLSSALRQACMPRTPAASRLRCWSWYGGTVWRSWSCL